MKKYVLYFLLFIIQLAVVRSVDGGEFCTESSYGTDFIFGFMDLPYYPSSTKFTDPALTIRVTSKHSSHFYVSVPSTDSASKMPVWSSTRYHVYKSEDVSINSSFINRYHDNDAGSSIWIKSNSPIAVLLVYNINSYIVSSPILPVTALSNSYALPSYTTNSFGHSHTEILVVALHDFTSVRFQSYDILLTKTLKENETYVYQKYQDISGTAITSNHPVAVFTSVTKGYRYSSHTQTTNYLSMQVPPVGKSALHFIVPALPSEVKSYKVRIYAPSKEARVEIHSTSDSTKHMHVYERIYYEYSTRSSSTLEILSDNPIMVVQIAISSTGHAMFMTNIPAVSQYLSSYLTDYADASHWFNTYLVTIRYEEALGLLVNGKPAFHNPELVAHRTPLGNFTVFTIPVTSRYEVSHVGDEPFGLMIFGHFTDTGDSTFGHSAGMQFKTDCPQTTPSGQIIG